MKKFILTCAFVSTTLFVNAAYLQWQVAEYNERDWDYVSIFLGDNSSSGEPLTNYSTEDGAIAGTMLTKENVGESFIVDLGDASAPYSFYVEYYKWNSSTSLPESYTDENLSVSGVGDFTASADQVYEATALNLSEFQQSTAWASPSSYTASVPEPTSGLLLMFGAAMLGLKRKNRSRA